MILKAPTFFFAQQQHCKLHVCFQMPESKHQVMQQVPVPVGGHCLPPSHPKHKRCQLSTPLALAGRAGTGARWHHAGLPSVSAATSRTSGAPAHPLEQLPLPPDFPGLAERDVASGGTQQGKQVKRELVFPCRICGVDSNHCTQAESKVRKGKEQEIKAAQTYTSELFAWLNETKQN